MRVAVRGWADSWVVEPLNDLQPPPEHVEDLLMLIGPTLVGYGQWHIEGPRGDGPGLLALHRDALRIARGDVDKGTAAATATYLDVRSRLEGCVQRFAAGRPVPDFRRPEPSLEQNAHRYHRVQARLRIHERWSPRRQAESLEEAQMEGRWAEELARAEARTYSLPLHFAAIWLLHDVEEKRSRAGRLKDRRWWWSMLLQGLGFAAPMSLGSDRNDPTEAVERIRLRSAVSLGLGRWLRRWARGRPYWQQVAFGLPDSANTAALSDVAQALTTLRPAMESTIADMRAAEELEAGEGRALHGTLLNGQNVRTSLRHFRGEGPDDQRARAQALAERLGRRVAARLLGDAAPPEARSSQSALMESLVRGESPPAAALESFQAALHEDADLMEVWLARVDAPWAYAVAEGLEPTPEVRAPRGWLLAVAVAVALLVVWLPGERGGGLRGGGSSARVSVELLFAGEGDLDAAPLPPGQVLRVGDRVWFRLAATAPGTRSTLWVSGPEGLVELRQTSLGLSPTLLREGEQLLSWRFERSGTYTFYASPEGLGECPERRCGVVSVRVEEQP